MKTFVYLRVSTIEQSEKSQMIGITNYLEREQITDINLLKDNVSGATKWRQRGLAKIINQAVSGDQLIVSELSRIGRSTSDVLDFLAVAAEQGLKVTAVKNNITFDESISSKIFSTVLALAAEIERDFIKQRTREGMENARNKGVKLGRPVGAAGKKKLDLKQQELQQLAAANVSHSSIAKLLGVSRGTVARSIKALGGTK